jgi:hypothetical protein
MKMAHGRKFGVWHLSDNGDPLWDYLLPLTVIHGLVTVCTPGPVRNSYIQDYWDIVIGIGTGIRFVISSFDYTSFFQPKSWRPRSFEPARHQPRPSHAPPAPASVNQGVASSAPWKRGGERGGRGLRMGPGKPWIGGGEKESTLTVPTLVE